MSVLRADNITKSFQEGRQTTQVLKGVSFKLYRGEIVALEGPSGSGKTTFLSILGCILSPTSGDLLIKGHRIDPRQPALLPEIRKRFIGFVFQQFNLFPALTAQENVEYAINIKQGKKLGAKNEALLMLERVGLGERKDYLPRDLSGGQKQRVAIARALAANPPILLADEPTANLDSHTGIQVLKLFRDLVKVQNHALLIVTHDPKVRAIADRVVRIEDGILIA